jgi:hypothetical protein
MNTADIALIDTYNLIKELEQRITQSNCLQDKNILQAVEDLDICITQELSEMYSDELF